jgi:hypothetical protein
MLSGPPPTSGDLEAGDVANPIAHNTAQLGGGSLELLVRRQSLQPPTAVTRCATLPNPSAQSESSVLAMTNPTLNERQPLSQPTTPRSQPIRFKFFCDDHNPLNAHGSRFCSPMKLSRRRTTMLSHRRPPGASNATVVFGF